MDAGDTLDLCVSEHVCEYMLIAFLHVWGVSKFVFEKYIKMYIKVLYMTPMDSIGTISATILVSDWLAVFADASNTSTSY